MPLSVAIVGSGPSGFYVADALLKSKADCKIDLIERLPTPFGLIRGGVAPDHQNTKRVSRSYEKIARAAATKYYGNVEVGRDVSLDELRAIYDAVVLAVGAPDDQPLRIPGADKKGVIGSAAFVGWYNGHPDFADLAPDLQVESIAVIGNGNVAIDVARVLVKNPQEMATSDIADHATRVIAQSPLKAVHILGRRGPGHAKFTNKELREMGDLAEATPVVDARLLKGPPPTDLGERERRLAERNLGTLQSFAKVEPDGKPKRVHFDFYASPSEVLGGDRVEGLRIERTRIEDGRAVGTGEFYDLACGAVITAIGYRGAAIQGAPFDESRGVVVHDDGRVAKGVYAAGWYKRGPTGVIGTNKADGDQAASQILADVGEGGKPGRPALERLLAERHVRWVDYREWKRIEAAEEAAAEPGAPRRKFVTIEDMLALLDEKRSGAGGR